MDIAKFLSRSFPQRNCKIRTRRAQTILETLPSWLCIWAQCEQIKSGTVILKEKIQIYATFKDRINFGTLFLGALILFSTIFMQVLLFS